MKILTEFEILEEEVNLPCADYIFKYIHGYGSMLFSKRTIIKTDHPRRFKCEYEIL